MRTQGAQEVPIKVVGNSTFGRYAKISSEKNFNMFVSDEWLVNHFGYKRVGEWPEDNAKGRGQFKSVRNNIILSVIGSSVILIDSNLVANFVGSISTSIGSLSFAENLNSQIAICDGLSIYIYNVAGRSLTKQTQITSFVPNYVDYHNTYFLIGNKDFTSNGSKWFIYEYDTDTTIRYFAEGALQTKSDHAVAVKRIPSGGNNVLVFGRAVTEIQTNVGGQLVYQRVSSMSIDFGVASVATIAGNDKIVCWLGVNESNTPAIMMYAPGGGRALSQVDSQGKNRTDGVNYLIENIAYPEKAFGYFLRKDGHLFYVLTCPHKDDNFTIYYDFNQDGFGFLTDYNMDFFPPVGVAYFNNKSYFLSYNNSSIYEIGTNYVTYNENIIGSDQSIDYFIPRVRITDNIRFPNSDQFIANLLRITMENGNDIGYNELTRNANVTYITDEDGNVLTTETGRPIVTEDSYTELPVIPKIDMSYSIDGGKTWSLYISQDLNYDAYRQNIVQWERMGACNDIVFKFRFWMKSHVVANNAVLEVIPVR